MTQYSTKLIEKAKIALAAILLMAIWGWGLVEYNNYMAKPAKEELYNQIPDIKLIGYDTYLKERLLISTRNYKKPMGFCTLYSVENVDDVMNYYDENLIKVGWNRGISKKNLNFNTSREGSELYYYHKGDYTIEITYWEKKPTFEDSIKYDIVIMKSKSFITY
jgi:hypothetical protein